MRRNNRRKNQKEKSSIDKMILYTGISVLVLGVVVFSLFMYSKKLNEDLKNSTMTLEDIASIAGSNTQNTESASTDLGKTVEESRNEAENNNINTTNNKTTNSTASNTNVNSASNTTKTNTSNKNKASTTTNTQKSSTTNAKVETAKKELNFEKPVEGEIVKEFAKDNLVYSETLKEWTTHSGIDIKADKTTVVKAAEEGTIKSIKNDPRYGLTIVIEHENGYQTIYSNLLTSEFVVEGEKVTKGQSIGTVGNTAVFEIADEPHLHFEILKDSIPENPNIYIK